MHGIVLDCSCRIIFILRCIPRTVFSKDLSGSRNMHTFIIIALAAVILSWILPLSIYQVAFSKSHKDEKGSSSSTGSPDNGNSNSNSPPQESSSVPETGQTPAGPETGQTPAGPETGQTPAGPE